MLLSVRVDDKNREKAINTLIKYLSKPSLLKLNPEELQAVATKCSLEIEKAIFENNKTSGEQIGAEYQKRLRMILANLSQEKNV